MKVLVVLFLCIVVSSGEHHQVTNPKANAVPNVQLDFHSVPSSHRSKRKIIDVEFFPAKKWPTSIQYHLDQPLSDAQKRLLRTIIEDDFEANTCLRFTELNSTIYADHQFMWFKPNTDTNICKAYIGRNNDTKTFNGQPLYLGVNCFNYRGTLVHMVSATLGMYNELQRPDRDDNIEIEWDNIQTAGKEFFVKQSTDVIDYHGTPYDFASAVHYSSDAWLKENLKENHRVPKISDTSSYTVRPKDPLLFRLLGQKSELSFYDIEVINRAYCGESCGNVTVNCQNGGYQDPNNCHVCKCPDGFSGELCGEFAVNVANSNHQCTPLSDEISVTEDEQCLSSPGYEQGKSYTTGDKCTWVLKAPEGSVIDMWFYESRFGLAYLSTAYSFCIHWVEIMYRGLDTPRGPRFCSLDSVLDTLPTKFSPLKSQSNEVMVIFKSPQAHLQSEYLDFARTGFKMCFKYKLATSTTTLSTTVSSNTSPGSPSNLNTLPVLPTGSSSSVPTTNKQGGAGAVIQDKPKRNTLPLVVGIITVLLVLLAIFGVVIVVLLYKRKRKQLPPVVGADVSAMENPGYAHAAPVVTYHNPDSDEKKLDVLDIFGVSMDDLPPKYEDVSPEDNVPKYTYAYSASPVEAQPSEPVPDYDNMDLAKKEAQSDQAKEPVYQNATSVSIKNLRSNFEQ